MMPKERRDILSQEDIDRLLDGSARYLKEEEEEIRREPERLAEERAKPLTEKQANALYWVTSHCQKTGFMLTGWELGRLLGINKNHGSRYLNANGSFSRERPVFFV